MTDLDSLNIEVRNRRRQLDALSGQKAVVLSRKEDLEREIASLNSTADELERVTVLFNSLGEDRQNEAQEKIEGIVTSGLQMIFDESLSFHISQSTKAKSAHVDFTVRTTLPGSVVETGVLDARGGGLSAVIGFLLRLVTMLLERGPREDNILVLDETFAHVSAEYLEPLGQFLREIRDKTGVQIIMVTHQPEFAEYADNVFRFTNENGQTKVSKDA